MNKYLKTGIALALCSGNAYVSAAVDCEYSVSNEWEAGFVAAINLTNSGTDTVNGWSVTWQYSDGSTLSSNWSSVLSGNNPYSASNKEWNGEIPPGGSVSFGVVGNKGTIGSPAEIPALSGDTCRGQGNNTPPVASYQYNQPSGTLLTFDASQSHDADGDVLSYQWDFGDGAGAQGLTPSHSFVPGTYSVSLTVSDGIATDVYASTITVIDLPPNNPPVASLSFSVDGLTAVFDASASTDADGDNLTYQWDFGDGVSRQGSNVHHTYAAAGLYYTTLIVSDGKDNTTEQAEVLVSDSSTPGQHVDNPFLGATSYINGDYADFIDGSIAGEADPVIKAKMAQVKAQPTAVWLDRIDAIYGGDINSGRLSLEQHLDQALLQKNTDAPMTVNIVVYNLPDRDCAALASNGTLHADQNGLAIYKRDYIDVIVDIVSAPRFKDLRIIAILEPDSLPNLVTNTQILKCGKVASDGTYVDGVQYALSRFSQVSNVYSYLDIAHSGWLGWESNMRGTIQLYTQVIRGVAGGDMTVLDGFITNVSNYTPTEEIFLPDPEFDFDGNYIGIKSSSYYEWNPVFDEKDFAEGLHASFVAQGFPQKLGMLIDTSRNGWGADDRPTGANDNAANEDQYVMDSKLDRRKHRGNWCNASGAGIGARPQTLPYGNNSVIDAFVWVKPPGESDGTSDETQTEPDDEGKSFDAMCSPNHVNSGGVLTGAMPDAPSAGAWFPAQFKMLVENAYPAL